MGPTCAASAHSHWKAPWTALRHNISLELCSQKAEKLLCCPVNFWKEINEHGHFALRHTFHHSDFHFCKTSWICSTVCYFFLGPSIPGWAIFRFLWFLRCWSWGPLILCTIITDWTLRSIYDTGKSSARELAFHSCKGNWKNLYILPHALLIISVTACITLAWKENQISKLRRKPKAVLKWL